MKHLIVHGVCAVAYHGRTWGTHNYCGPPPPKEVAEDVLALLYGLVGMLRYVVDACKTAQTSALSRFKEKKAAAEAYNGEHGCSYRVIHADESQRELMLASQAWASQA